MMIFSPRPFHALGNEKAAYQLLNASCREKPQDSRGSSPAAPRRSVRIYDDVVMPEADRFYGSKCLLRSHSSTSTVSTSWESDPASATQRDDKNDDWEISSSRKTPASLDYAVYHHDDDLSEPAGWLSSKSTMDTCRAPACPTGDDAPLSDDEEDWVWATESTNFSTSRKPRPSKFSSASVATKRPSKFSWSSDLVEVKEFDDSKNEWLQQKKKMCTTFASGARKGRRCTVVDKDTVRPAMYTLTKTLTTLQFRNRVMEAPFLECDLRSIQEVVAEEGTIVRIDFTCRTGSRAVRFAEASIQERDFFVEALSVLSSVVKKQL